MSRLASWWHTDGDLGRDMECLTDMNKSKKAGFLGFRSTPDSIASKPRAPAPSTTMQINASEASVA